MKTKKINFILIFVAMIAIGFAIIRFIITNYFPEPKNFVKNQTFVIYSDLFFVYEITKYSSNVKVAPEEGQRITLGFVTDPWNLNFGIMPIGSYGTRHLNISNSGKNRVRVFFKVYGNIEQLISFSRNNFILNPGQSAYIDVFLKTTNLTKLGNYTGQIDVITKKPKFNFLYLFL